MKIDTLNEKFINAIKEKIPQRTMIANQLSQILCIEKEAVYRRLRKEVPFSFNEVALICFTLGISLDNLIGTVDDKSKPFHLKLIDFINPTQEDFQMLEFMTKLSDSMDDFSNTEYGAAMNMIPITLCVKYEYLLRFYIYKWIYQNFTPATVQKFKDVHPHPGIVKRMKEFPRIANLAAKICYIWSESIFLNVVKDVTYFNAINLINNEEKELIKQDLHSLLNELEIFAIKGVNEQGNKIYIYISNVSVETSYSYTVTPNFCLTMIMTFTLNQVASVDTITSGLIRQFMHSLKRTSTLISESGEMYRIRFFQEQRAIVNTL